MLLHIWSENLLLTAGLLWIVLAAWGTGMLLLRIFGPLDAGRAEEAVIASGLGLGAFSLLMLLLGAAGLYRQLFLVPVAAILSTAPVIALRGAPRPLMKDIGKHGGPGTHRLLSLLLGTGMFLTWLTALSPPIFYDTLVYHLGVPNLFLLRGGIEPLPTVLHSNFPLGVEMLYLIGAWAGGLRLAVLVGYGMGALSIFALWVFAERHWGRGRALLAALFFATSPMFFLLSRYAISETGLCLYILLLLLCLYRWWEGEPARWVALAGIFGGLAYGTKYVGGIFGIFLPAVFLGADILRKDERRSREERLAVLGLFALAAFGVSVPWEVKSVTFTGQPFFPAMHSLFPSAAWSEEQARALASSAHAVWSGSHGLRDFLALPWNLAVLSGDFGAGSRATWLWPLSLLGSVAVFLTEKEYKTRTLILFLAGYFILWSGTFWMARFLLPAAGLGCLVVALAITKGSPSRLRTFPATAVAVLLVLFHGTVIFMDRPTRDSLRPAVGLSAGKEYLAGRIRSYQAVNYANAALPRDAKILVLGEARVAYLRRDHFHQTVFDRSVLEVLAGNRKDLEGAVGGLAKAGVTHVLINVHELQRLERMRRDLPFSNDILPAFLGYLESRASLLAGGDGVLLFRLPSAP